MSVKLVSRTGFATGREYGAGFEAMPDQIPDYQLRIEPQAQLGEHRVDFCLTLDGSVSAQDGRPRSASNAQSRQEIVTKLTARGIGVRPEVDERLTDRT